MSKKITQYEPEDNRVIDPVLKIDRVDLHNAMVTVIKDHISKVVDEKRIQRWCIIWEVGDMGNTFVSTHNRGVASLSEPTPKIRYIQLSISSSEGLNFDPKTEKIIGPDKLGNLNLPPKEGKLMTYKEFFDKFKPIKEDSTDCLQSPKQREQGNSKVAARKAAKDIEWTIRRNFDVDKESAQEFAEEFAEELRQRGMLTEDYMGSSGFYHRAITAYTNT